MKNHISTLFLIFASIVGYSQDCEYYFPSKIGTTFEIKHFDKKAKNTGLTKQRILNSESTERGSIVSVISEYFDAKNKSTGIQNYNVKCEDDKYSFEMNNFLEASSMESFKDAEIIIKSDNLSIPKNFAIGDGLNEGTINITTKTDQPVALNMYVKVFNRKVEAVENVTCPAGTFECIKISYDIEMKMIFKIHTKGCEWIAKNVGTVKSESYDKTGKLTGYSLLSKIN